MTTTNLYMHFTNPFNPAQSGLTVEAWPVSAFTHSPVGNPGAYPPSGSHTATTTTDSSGDCELTGLTVGANYFISLIDINGKPWFFSAPAGVLGNSSGTRRVWAFNPDPSSKAPPFNGFTASLTSGIVGHGTLASQVGMTVQPVAPWIASGYGYYIAAAVQPPLLSAAGFAVFDPTLGGLELPQFAGSSGTWSVTWGLHLVSTDLTQQLWIDSSEGTIVPSSEGTIHPHFTTGSTNVVQIGADLEVPATAGAIKSAAGGYYYQGYLSVDLQGGEFS